MDQETRTTPATIALRGVSHHFGKGSLRRRVLANVSVEIQPGEIVLLTGPSGSGKTTLLTLIGALRSVQDGEVEVLGHRLDGASAETRVAVRRHIGFVFQAHNLLKALTARENVELALELHPELSPAQRTERALEALARVGLADHADKLPRRMSGGQRQRVALARALAGHPGLLLADEPTASLDRETGREVIDLIRELARSENASVLLVTHDDRILDVADRILHLEDGQLTSYAVAVAQSTGARLASLAGTAGRAELFAHLEDLPEDRFEELVDQFTAEALRVREAIQLGQSSAYEQMLDRVLDAFTWKIGRVLDAERATLLLVDRAAGELRSKYASGKDEGHELQLRIPLGRGIAGAVAASGRLRNVPDAYAEPDFDTSIDHATGFRTRSILCVPLRDSRQEVIAVAQVLNRKDGRPFDRKDEEDFLELTESMGVVLESWRSMAQSAVTP